MIYLTGASDLKQRIADATQALIQADSELRWELAASAADAAGVVDPTPISDIVGAGIALRNGDLWGAGLSVASMVPYAGDALAKPAKALRSTKRLSELQQRIVKLQSEIRDLQTIAAKQKTVRAEELNNRINSAASASGPRTAKGSSPGAASKPGHSDKDCEQCKVARLPRKDVPCFHPYNKANFKKLSPGQRRKYLEEMAQQLKKQEEGLASISASEFKAARDAYASAKGRNPQAAAHQRQTRDDYEAILRRNLYNANRRKVGAVKAKEIAANRTREIMSNLAALHDPDMIAGGWLQPKTSSMGRKDVNSSIGGSWNKNGRLNAMDEAANRAIKEGRGNDLMNVKLEICRGEGLR